MSASPTQQAFWADPAAWPLDPAGFVFLARAVDMVGRAMCGDDWTGQEAQAQLASLPARPGPTTRQQIFEDYHRHLSGIITAHVEGAEPLPAALDYWARAQEWGGYRIAMNQWRAASTRPAASTRTIASVQIQIPPIEAPVSEPARPTSKPVEPDEQRAIAAMILDAQNAEPRKAFDRFAIVSEALRKAAELGDLKSAVWLERANAELWANALGWTKSGPLYLVPAERWFSTYSAKRFAQCRMCVQARDWDHLETGAPEAWGWLFVDRQGLDALIATIPTPTQCTAPWAPGNLPLKTWCVSAPAETEARRSLAERGEPSPNETTLCKELYELWRNSGRRDGKASSIETYRRTNSANIKRDILAKAQRT